MAEIAENLHRAELTVQERADQIAEWVRLTALEKGAQLAPPGGRQPHDKGIKAAVRDLGINRDEAQRAVKIAAISEEAKAAAVEEGFDNNQSALLVIAKEIEAQAKRRLADEYDAAQERGEVAAQGQHAAHVPGGNMRASVADLGLTRKQVHEARQIRDARKPHPGLRRAGFAIVSRLGVRARTSDAAALGGACVPFGEGRGGRIMALGGAGTDAQKAARHRTRPYWPGAGVLSRA